MDIFEDNILNKKIEETINELFDLYKNINNKEEIYKEYVNNIMKNGKEDIKDANLSMDIDLLFNKSILKTNTTPNRGSS